MQSLYPIAKIVSIVAFASYGLLCLCSRHMEAEFERFGLSRFRRLTGALEVLGALGLAAGYLLPALTAVAAAGLTLLMALGVWARLRVGDPLVQTLPALVLLALNAFVLAVSLRH